MANMETIQTEVPVESPDTEKLFESSLIKAKMVYRNIERPFENFQFALAYNVDNGIRTDYTSIYTSSIDGKVYTKSLDIPAVFINKAKFRPGYYLTGCVSLNTEGGCIDTSNAAIGLVAFNGREVLKPKYAQIDDLQRSYLHVHESRDSYCSFIVDYMGELQSNTDGKIYKCNIPMILNGHKCSVIYYQRVSNFMLGFLYNDKKFKNSNHSIPAGKIYIIYRGKLYMVEESYAEIKDVKVQNNRIEYIANEKKYSISSGQIIKQMKEVIWRR